MAVRTIDAPGIEMHEIDKSQYSPAMTGTKVLVTGFANSGEDYIPMIFTSKSAWLKYYGEPDNEAERYFYTASMEVLNQNGVVNCCKLPYENAARDKFVAMKYKLNTTNTNTIKTVGEALENDLSTIKTALVNSDDYNTDVLEFFVKNVNITDVVDKNNLTKSDAKITVLSNDVNKNTRSDGRVLSTETSLTGYSFFDVYDVGSLSSIEAVTTTYNSQMDKSDLIRYVDDIENIVNGINPKFKMFYSIKDEEIENTTSVKQTIQLYTAKDSNANKILLSAENIVDLTDDIHQIKGINGLLEFDVNTPEIPTDDIFATFTGYGVSQTDVTDGGSGLQVLHTNSYTGFRLTVADRMSDDEKKDACNYIIQNIRDNNYILVNVEKQSDLEDVATEYFNYLKTNKSAIAAATVAHILDVLKWSEIKDADSTVDKMWTIEASGTPSEMTMDKVDEYRTDESRVGINEIVVVDKTRKGYVKIPEDKNHKDAQKESGDTKYTECEMIGIIPIITTAANALQAQSLINVDKKYIHQYETIEDVKTLGGLNTITSDLPGVSIISKRLNNVKTPEDNPADFFDSLALEANQMFTPIALQADGGFDRENMKKIGLVVVQAYLDASEGNKISFQTVEAFVGSLDRDAKNPSTGATTFIDTIVNEQSQYVNIFTNCFPTDSMKKQYKEVDIFTIEPTTVASMGFYESMTKEDIDVSESILKALDLCYDKVADINERDIDIVVDGGVSNIAQFVKTVYGQRGVYDPISPDAAIWKCQKDNDVKMWKTIIQKYDNFCKNIRKDCMFIADGPRPLCLRGQQKIVRPSKPSSTIDAEILPYVKYLTGLNTSYGAGYCDWFEVADEFSGDYFWCPPSIKACGVYINTDLNFNYWDAPAGLNRGIVAALDVAFSPTNKQAGQIYTKSWNYAINYPADGIVLEGQRTLQTKPSALDRVNVRRLMLRLERQVYKTARYLVYEGHTAYLRQRFIDLIDPIFKQAKVGGGLYDYKIICDESNNTPHTIDNNELHISIGLKPTKTVEFIIANFIILPTGGSWDEML